MSLSFPNTILAYHKARLFTQARSLAEAPCSEIVKQMNAFRGFQPKQCKPEAAACTFYMLDQAAGRIAQNRDPYEPMPQGEIDLLEAYNVLGAEIGLRAFYYLLVITTREARHLKNKSEIKVEGVKQFGEKAMAYIGSIPDESSKAMAMISEKPPACTLGQYVGALRYVFYAGKWGGGYGGKAWGQVTDCLHEFVQGNTSLAMMTDTVWTLAHNNGPIFNKGGFFENYGSHLITMLDVQNSGQMVNLCLEDKYGILDNALLSSEEEAVQSIAQKIVEVLPELAGPLDWFKVEALGAKKSHHGYKQTQLGLGITSDYEGKTPDKTPIKPKGPVLVLWPGCEIPLIKMKRAA